jgi:MinD-like ATPase involved in chromosome partitioning or flagellar assembly/tetratricopeptide (TPR) repeat protein
MPGTPEPSRQKSHNGRIVTFYSYKGGTGRTMALANVAWILAANGYRVLAADWDLESPGLHRFFHPFLETNMREDDGIIDLIRRYKWAASKVNEQERLEKLIPERARVEQYSFSLNWEFPDDGALDFLSPGRQNDDYSATITSLDWDDFYHRLNGGQFLDAVGVDMRRNYDYTLIDSRTGLSDVSSICTVHLPDVLVDCFTLSTQGIEGAAQVALSIQELHKDRGIRVLPVPMRVDQAEKEKVEAGHALAVRLFAGLPADLSEQDRREYWSKIEVPYRAFYAYEETLAVFGDPPGSPASLLAAFERIASLVSDGAATRLPPMDQSLRNRTKQLFVRRAPLEGDQFIVEFDPEDQAWGEWIAWVLHRVGVNARERRLEETSATLPAGPDEEDLTTTQTITSRTITVISATYMARFADQSAAPREHDLTVYVMAPRSLAEPSPAQSAFLAEASEREAEQRLRQLIGISGGMAIDPQAPRPRYPGTEPKIFRALARNPMFTGREKDLGLLREELREYGTALVVPVSVQGLGGVGKTQVALEYVHRFKSDYDLVWWVDCGQPQFIDASLADLGKEMREKFGIGAPATAYVEEASRLTLQALSQVQAEPRWLLVFDNAEDIDEISPYIPAKGGHVLITSRSRDWADHAHARPVQIEVFTRPESVQHLRQRIPSISPDDADKVADALGDLPVAVAAAGAYFAVTGFTVADYLTELERQAPRMLSESESLLADYPHPVKLIWDLSLKRLADRSPAAARLLQLCSVMSTRIATSLLYSPAMAQVLQQFEPGVSERMVIARLVREMNRLALIKLDGKAGRVIVHQLVQAVVRDRMSEEEIAAARQDVHRVLAAARPDGDVEDPETWGIFREIWPHLEPSQAMYSRAEPVCELFVDRVRYLWQRHDLDRGVETAAEVERAWTAMLSNEPDASVAKALRTQLLRVRFNLANILRDQAKFGEARASDEHVLQEQRDLLGEDHPHTLMTAGSLAADLKALGRYQEALDRDEVTYGTWRDLYGEDYPRTLSAAYNLAASCLLTGAVGRALRLDADTLDRRRTALSPQHPRTLDSASHVVRDLVESGRYAQASKDMESVWKACVEQDPESIAALNAQVLLAISMRCAGRATDAEGHFAAASDRLASRFGNTSTEALSCRLSHSANMLAIGRIADAEKTIRLVRGVFEQPVRLGPAHPHTLICQVDLAGALRAGEKHDQAMEEARTANAGLAEALGSDHPTTLAARMVLGVLLAERGDLAEAEEVEAPTAEELTRRLGQEHPDSLRCRANLLLTRHQLGIAAAKPQRDLTIAQLAALIGEDHPDIDTLTREHRVMRTLDLHPF